MIFANVSLFQVGEPSSLRAWMWTIAAPASYARFASSAISTGVYGIAGQCFLVVTAPVSAHERMTFDTLAVYTPNANAGIAESSAISAPRGWPATNARSYAGVRGDVTRPTRAPSAS